MKLPLRLSIVTLVGAALLATLPAAAQGTASPPAAAPDVPDTLDLKTSLLFALDNNFDIRQAKERIRQQEGVVVEVSAQLVPNVSAAGSYQRNSPVLSPYGDNNTWGLSINARQILYAGGGITAGVKSAQLAGDAAVLAFQAAVNQALLQVRTQFYTVLVSRERIKVQEENVDLLEHQLQDVKNRFEAGTVSNFEVLRAEVALANAQTPLITARNDYRIAIDELRQVLGFTGASRANVSKTPEFVGKLEFTPVTFDLVSSLATAQEKRPDLLRLEKLESAAEQGVYIQRAAYYPNVALFGSYVRNKAPGLNSFGDGLDGGILGVQSTWNIFDGRATAGRVAQSRSLLEQAKLAFSEARLAVDVDVRRAISSVQQANELSSASQKVVQEGEEAVRLANARYSAGTATQLDVLQSQVDLTTARLNEVQAYYTFNVATAQLRQAMGLTDELVSGNQ